jgi:hypothetical protein
MNNISTKTLSSLKYVYLIAFFILLAGIFHPLISNTSFESVIGGTLTLFVGLAGGILLYKASISKTKGEIFFIIGFGLIGISLYFIYEFAGRY